MSTGEILYRPVDYSRKGELGFILKPLIRYIAAHPAPLLKRAYVEAAKLTANTILRRSTVIVAEYAHEAGQLFGFVIYEPQRCLHLVYVKELLRGNGIGTDLLAQARQFLPNELEYSVKTKNAKSFLPEARYNPRLVNNPKRHD